MPREQDRRSLRNLSGEPRMAEQHHQGGIRRGGAKRFPRRAPEPRPSFPPAGLGEGQHHAIAARSDHDSFAL
jgi:hypothetical protein